MVCLITFRDRRDPFHPSTPSPHPPPQPPPNRIASRQGDRAASEALRFLPPGRGPGPKRRFSRRRRHAARDGATSSSFARSSTVNANAGKDAVFGDGDGAGKGLVDGELAVIACETSPLLTELLDGKLGATIEEFFRREAAGARERRRRG